MEAIKEYFGDGQTILIDKPVQWTSFDIVKKIRNTVKVKKVGHAGTLDPLATGLLIVCTGKHTKKIEEYQGQEKEYTGIIELGKTTPSFDLETEFDKEFSTSHIEKDALLEACKQLTGDIKQIPPIYSAIKVGGERLYKKARRKENIELEPRAVSVSTFELTSINLPEVHFRIVCSKGTYIRSIARDFGNLLDAGAYLKSLRRTRIGDFMVSNSYQIEDFVENVNQNQFK